MGTTTARILVALLLEAAGAIVQYLKHYVETILRRFDAPLWENHPKFV